MTAFYSGLGHLIELQYRLPANSNLGNQAQLFSSEKFTLDPLGNIYAGRDSTNIHKHDGFQSVVTTSDASYAPLAGQPSTGRLRQRRAGSQYTDYTYDHAGNTVFSSATTFREDRASFYGADGLLRVAEHRFVQENGVDPAAWWWWETFEEYRYDALGRRILVRMRRNCYLTSPGEACRFSTIRRTVWEGPRELYEIQMPGGDLEPATELEKDTAAVQRGACQAPSCQTYFDPNPLFGRVGYAYGGGVDEPLSIIRINYVDKPWDDPSYRVWLPFSMVPHWNWRGQAEYGTFGDGGVRLCVSPSSTRCVEIQWRAKAFAFTQQTQDLAVNASTNHTWAWLGTLRDLKEDGTGTQYHRNRYMDPTTGRFTQEDPAGLAGGLNLYGFAGGDPVTFSDPFGLSADTVEFADDESAATYKQLQNLAANAAKSSDEKVAAAGVQLGSFLNGLESSSNTVTIDFRGANAGAVISNWFFNATGGFVGKPYTRTDLFKGGNASVIIDPTRTSSSSGLGSELILLHELGHASSWMSGVRSMVANWAAAINAENVGRAILGCVSRQNHTEVPPVPSSNGGGPNAANDSRGCGSCAGRLRNS